MVCTEPSEIAISDWKGFKILGDNVDKHIRPSFQQVNNHTISLHYFHSYAVADRVNFSSLSDVRPQSVSVDTSTFLLNRSTDLAKTKQVSDPY